MYHISKKPWGKSEMSIYIDGELKKVAVMKAPNFSDVSLGHVDICISLVCSTQPGNDTGMMKISSFTFFYWEGPGPRPGAAAYSLVLLYIVISIL